MSDIAFIVWGFPELTQTFIHREMVELQRRGARLHVLAGPRRAVLGEAPEIAALAERASYLGSGPRWVLRGLRWAARHPLRFLSTLLWMLALPHRTALQRARGAAMVLAAAAHAPEVERRGVRYLHAHFAGYPSELAMALSRLTDVPWGASFHAVGIYRDRNLLAEKVADARLVLTCTAHNVEHLRRIAPRQAATVRLCHHGLSLQDLPEVEPAPRGRPRWLAVGRLVPKKGFDRLIEAAAELDAGGVDFELAIAGDGPERDALQARIDEHWLSHRVVLLGRLSHDNTLAEMARCYGLVAPSVRDREGDVDGIPNVVLEAMALGRPVIGSQLSGIPEVVEPGKTGLLVPPGDAGALAEAMAWLGRHRRAARRFGQAGRARIERDFDVRQNGARMLTALSWAAAGGAELPRPENSPAPRPSKLRWRSNPR